MANVEESDFPIAYGLALVGSGDFDALISSIRTPWDVAAGGLIASEAGAKVTDLFNEAITDWSIPVSGILAAASAVYEEFSSNLLPVLKDFR